MIGDFALDCSRQACVARLDDLAAVPLADSGAV
jgi:hypothetical protein